MEVDIQRLRRWGSFCNMIGKRQLDSCVVLKVWISPSMFEPSKRNPLDMTVLQSPLEFDIFHQTRRLKACVGLEKYIKEQLRATEVGGNYGRRRKRTVNTVAHRLQPLSLLKRLWRRSASLKHQTAPACRAGVPEQDN